MKKSLLYTFIFCSATPYAHAGMTKRLEADLRTLDPQTRLEQVCDLKAMEVVAADKEGHHAPDRAIGEATKASSITGDTIVVTGGALRSHGKWHELSYTCKASPDHLKVIQFDYKLGPYIPKSEWDADGLWN